MKTDNDIGVPSTSGTYRNLIRCSYCQFSTESKSDVIEHILNDHREPDLSWKCNMCVKKTSTKFRSTFKTHLHTHFGVKPFSCKFCLYSASIKGNLKRHVKRNHPNGGTDNRLASSQQSGWSGNLIHCSYCQFTRKRKSDIIEHILNDHQEPNSSWKCNMCKKNICIKYRSTFKTHLQIHFGLKTFSCTFCNQSFSRKFDLKRHVKTQHPNEVIENSSASQHEENNEKLKLQILSSQSTHIGSSNDKTPHIDKNIDIENEPKSLLKQKKSIPFHENKCDFSEKPNKFLPSPFSYPSKANSPNTTLDHGKKTITKFKYDCHSETPAIERDLCAAECPNYVSNECDDMQKSISNNSYFRTTPTNNIMSQNKTSYTEIISSSESSFHTDTVTSMHILPVSGTSSSETIIERTNGDRPLDLSATGPNCITEIQKLSSLQKKNI